jgi:hypothetical protein
MLSRVGRTAGNRAIQMIGALCLVLLLVGCGEIDGSAAPAAAGAPAQVSIEEAIAAIEAATPNPITPEAVAETFVLGGTATDVQRQMMEKELVGSVVEWDLLVYDVKRDGDRYEVTSQPIEIASAAPLQLVGVVAWIQPQGPEDDALLQRVKTGDPIRIRGLVQGIVLRTMVQIGPGVVVQANRRDHVSGSKGLMQQADMRDRTG